MSERARSPVLALLALSLSACGLPIASGSSFASGVDLTGPLTFSWDEEADHSVGDPRLQDNPFFEDRLHEAVEWELSLRGIHQVEDGSPDLLIHHHLTLADHEMVEEVIDEEGYSRTEVYSYEEGTIVVHIVDARTGDDSWVAWGQANVGPALSGPSEMRRWVYAIVEEMFSRWPVLERTE